MEGRRNGFRCTNEIPARYVIKRLDENCEGKAAIDVLSLPHPSLSHFSSRNDGNFKPLGHETSHLEILLRDRGIEGKKASINLAAHRAVGIPPWPKRVQNLALYNAHASVKKSGVGGWGLATVSSP